MKFLLDEHMPAALAEALAVLSRDEGFEVQHLRRKFPARTDDCSWLTELGAEGGWAFVTIDRHILSRPAEYRALLASGLTGFFLANQWNQTKLWDRAALLIAWWPTIVKANQDYGQGHHFDVPYAKNPKDLRPRQVKQLRKSRLALL